MVAASRSASHCGPKSPRVAVSPVRQPALRCGSVIQQARLPRIVAVARENNFASRVVLGGIGMTECASFTQSGYRMVMYESLFCVV